MAMQQIDPQHRHHVAMLSNMGGRDKGGADAGTISAQSS